MELHNLHASPNVIRVIKSRKITWLGYVAWGIQNFGRKTWREQTTGKT